MPKQETSSQYPWFAVRVKFRHEKAVSTALRMKGYVEFLPLRRGLQRHGNRYRSVDLPLFPTYVFCRFDPLDRLPILTTPGVFSIVGTAKTPVPVDEEELSAVRVMTASGVRTEPWPFLHVGDQAYIEEGPLRGIRGILQRSRNQNHLVISITLLQRSLAVEIDPSWISPSIQKTACA